MRALARGCKNNEDAWLACVAGAQRTSDLDDYISAGKLRTPNQLLARLAPMRNDGAVR